MAVENLVNLVTDRFNPDAINALKSNLGIDAFSGQSTSTADMTGAGWLCVAALNTIKDDSLSFNNEDIKKTLKDILDSQDSTGIVLKEQTNSKDDNLLMQLINYYINSTTVELSDIISLMIYLFGDSTKVENLLKATNSSGYSAAMVITYSNNYITNNADVFSNYGNAFTDLSYQNNSNILPIARLMIKAVSDSDIMDDALKAIQDIVTAVTKNAGTERYDKFNKVFLPFPSSTTEQADNSLIEFIYSIGTDALKKDIDTDGVLSTVLSYVLSKPTDAFSPLINSIDTNKCIGIRYGEVGFSIDSYKSNIVSLMPKIDVSFHIANRLGNSTINSDIYKYFTPFLFPVPDNAPIEGYTFVGKLSEMISINDTNDSLVEADVNNTLSGYLSKANSKAAELSPDDDLKKFFILNAILGTCRDFSDNATMNLYSPINLILNKVNKAHKSWCTSNNKNFDDYKDVYETIISTLFGDVKCLGFDTAYKYWCNEYDKMF